MIEKLNGFDLKTSEIERLASFQSRDGFMLLEETEFDEMQKYFEQFPMYKNIIAFLTDGNSNYWCLYISGAMKGMICYLSHDEPSLEPKFKSVLNLLNVIEENPEAYDFYDLDRTLFDFPTIGNTSDFEQRNQIIEQLRAELLTEKDEDTKQQIAFSIIALTSTDEIEKNIYPFLDDTDMYVQERAIEMLGFHKYKPAKEKLMELKTSAMPNGRTAAANALKKIEI